jgi:O-antigen/teichoic acid export membrane protein
MSPADFTLSMLYFGALVLADSMFVSANNQCLAYYLSKYKTFKEHLIVSRYLSMFTSKIAFIFYFNIAVIFFIFTNVSEIKFEYIYLIGLSFLYVLLGVYKSSLVIPYNVRQDHKSFSMYTALESCIVFCVVISALFLAKQHSMSAPLLFILSMLVGRSAVLVVIIIFQKKQTLEVKKSKDNVLEKPSSKQILNYFLPFASMGVIGWLSIYLDRYILNIISGTSDIAGIAGIASYIACVSLMLRPYNILSAILTNYFRPKLFKARQEDLLKEVKKICTQWVIISFTFGIFASLIFYTLNHFIASILLAEVYREGAIELMTILSIGFCFLLINHAVDNLYFSNGSSVGLLIPQIISIVVLVLGLLIFTSKYGLVGAAIARALSDFSKLLMTVFVARHSFKFKKGVIG